MTATAPTIDRCRVCGGPLYSQPLLRFENMPGAAQFMPDEAALATERGADLDIRQCSACGLVQLDAEPVHYFREVVRAAAFSPEMRGFRLEQFRDFVDRFGLKGRKVVEIGCGRGEYLDLMAEQGVDAHGLEHGEESVRLGEDKPYPIRRGYVEDADTRLEGGPFDAFFILNFLEHMPRPVESLRGIAANLADGGVGLVEVPNFDMIVRAGLFSEFIADHLFYFTRATLTQTLTMAGFEVLDCAVVWHDYCLSATVRKRAPSDLSHLLDYQGRIDRDVSAFIDRFPAGRVAVWGAGHQALAVLSLLRLEKRIAYVLDSAPFKQGRYTPATHLPIVPPSRLREDPVPAVIVMAASYSDEVARIIRRDYASDIAVAILRDHGLEIV